MTDATAGRVPVADATRARPQGLRGWLDAARDLLHRPLTPYYLLLGGTAMLLSIGLMEVLSASSVASYKEFGNSYYWFQRQIAFVALGIPAAFVASRLPHKLLRALAWPGIGLSLILIGLTRVPGLGVRVNGNTNWLDLGFVQIQPSELAKLSLILWCADVYARKERRLSDWKHIVIPVVPVFATATALVAVLGHDLGTGLILMSLLIGMLWVAGAPGKMFGLSVSLIGVIALVLATTDRERMSRLTGFTDPFKDFHGNGWQSGHGLLGMASGGLLGKGIGASQQKWGSLPAPHTDFIFAVLGEELGLIGTLLVLALFLGVFWAGFRVSASAQDPFVRYCAAGITIWLTVQTVINIAMVLALFPVVGLPLPFVSYGGSSLVPELVAIGLLVAFARREPAAARALSARRRHRARERAERNALGRAARGGS